MADEESESQSEKMAQMKTEVADSLEEGEAPPHKRHKQQKVGRGGFARPASLYSQLDEPSPLGLRLRKSPSLLELIQFKLSQGNMPKVGNHSHSDKESKGGAASVDKMKASNFPASVIKIGNWEYKSRHEGDLVAKCYFAKHKLVWEVLDGGLKNKIEIQWSGIIALKAKYMDDGPGTLNVSLARQPLFFRETNPQPRKHTLWQATSDFTGGQASIHSIQDAASPSGVQSSSSKNDQDTLGRHLGSYPRDSPSPCSARDGLTVVNIDNGGVEQLKALNKWDQIMVPGLRSSMSMIDLVCHLENRISEQGSSSNPDLSNEDWQSLQILDVISRCLFSDSQSLLDSDEKTLISRVNSLCCILQKDAAVSSSIESAND